MRYHFLQQDSHQPITYKSRRRYSILNEAVKYVLIESKPRINEPYMLDL